MNQPTLLALTLAVQMMAFQQGKGQCVTSCEGLQPGNYQSCLSCSVYVTCTFGGSFFDVKNCRGASETCDTNGGNMGTCVTDCEGLQPGNYQSCLSCSVYVTCTAGGSFFDNRPCPATLVWDDNVKNCRGASETCP